MPDSTQPKPPSYSILHAIVPWVARLYLLLVGKTARITLLPDAESSATEKSGGNYIYAIWHSRLVFLVYSHRFRNVCALVSKSKDGEYLARLLSRFGFDTVRGSTSKGGTAALLNLLDRAQAGQHPVVTPDGPKGPQRTVQSGILLLAQKTGLPVIPVSCGLSRKIVFNSWDKFQLPLPFSKAVVAYGRPIHVGEQDDTAAKSEEIRLELDRITEQADKLAVS
ncbi:MAG: lysophospholipid acyltransferase family protein [Elusimicrobia bacterium]|nr:lysophospholipid acyltransferase family protein [Elusimicrobiota bacterium]